MYLLRLALASLGNRRFTAWLTVFAIALSVCLLLAVERVRTEARASFANTISGTDLIVGARSGSVNLLLYSVFRIGNATNNIRWESFEQFAQHRQVKWAIPISLGDSHRGYRVMGTSPAYFEHYRYARSQPLQLSSGRAFADDPFEVVLGAEVAQALNYQLNQELVLAHGVATISLVKHDDKPFKVVGILARTGTPVDRTLHISLAGMEALHVDWQNGMPARGAAKVSAEQARAMDLQPKQITAFMLGLNSKIATFSLQREINEFRGEPLLAILPGVALQELWSLMGTAEKALFVVSLFVVLTGLIGMLTAILTSLNERRREMAILRSVGARPWHIASLLIVEAFALALAGVLLGLLLLYLGIAGSQGYVQANYGLYLPLNLPSRYEWTL
ncbi:MAG: FtsX-like permease family protein, partial [Pseudomonas sp.]|nr:FtsX-like permease family protein [Pseudomonas sp.]